MEQKVQYAKLHTPIFVPGAGNLKDTLVADATGPTKDLVMYLTDAGMLCAVVKGVEILIPQTSISHMVLEKSNGKTKV